MLHKNTIEFLKKLKKNNNKEWFESNKPQFDEIKKDFLQLIEILIKSLSKVDLRYGDLKPSNCLFRMNRDIRFSKDKSPYKTNLGAAFHIGGKKSGYAAFYIHIEPGKSFVGGGLWGPDAETLKRVRQEIDYNYKSFEKLMTQKEFVSTYGKLNEEDKLKNVPKAYPSEHKAAEYLKLKHFVTGKSYADNTFFDKKLTAQIEKDFNTLSPFIDFLNRAIEG